MAFQRKLTYKIYSESGNYISTLSDVIKDFSITKQINGGDSDFSFVLSRKIDDFSEGTEIKFNNRVKVYLKDSHNPNGDKLVAYGYISSYQPYLRGKEEKVEVTCLSAVSKLSNDFYRSGTAAVASDLGVELSSKRVDEMMTAIVNHYRSTETNSMIASPSGLTATTDNSGALFSFDMRFFNLKHLDALRESAKYLARYKDGGYWFYWRINTVGELVLKNLSTTADHKFVIGKHITNISGQKSIEDVINRVYFWNEKGTVDPDYLKMTADDSASQNDYDIKAEYLTDSSITNSSAASLLTESRVYDKKDPKVKIEISLNGEYDLSSIEPGQTCQIFNLKNNPFKIGTDEVLVIYSIEYNVDSAILEIAEAGDNFEDIVEEERQRLDKELRWFGFITQQLTAAQLGPANRTWTTNLEFFATSGSDAYRKVDWNTGTIYIPTSSGSSAGVRVVDAGSTGNMSASTDYYIYLDEKTFNTSAANSDTGTGDINQGADFLVDSSKSWTNNQWAGYIVTIGGQTKIIKSNTSTVLTIEDRWTIVDSTAAYTIKKMTLSVTTDKSVAAANTSIIFSNVRANTNTASEAMIVSSGTGSSSTINYTLDGLTNIAQRSIEAVNIKASTITSNEINTGAINIGVWAGNLDNVSDGSSYVRTSPNEKTGAARAYSGLNSSYRPSVGILTSDLAAISLPGSFTGVRVDTAGIYGYSASVPTFYIRTSDGAFYAQGTLQSGATYENVVIQNNSIQLRYNTTQNAEIKTFYYASGYGLNIYTNTGTGNGNYISMYQNVSTPAAGGIDFGVSGTHLISIDVYGLSPSAHNSLDLGYSTSLAFRTLYIGGIYLNGSYRTSWPTSGTTVLSGLTIDTSKNWGGYSITNLAGLTVTGITLNGTYRSSWPTSIGDININSNKSWGGYAITNLYGVSGPSGYLYLSEIGRIQVSNHFDPTGTSLNMGGSTRYWSYINCYEISKQGGGGWGCYDDGVEMQDGRIVSDVEAIEEMKPDLTKITDYGKPIIDVSTLPKDVYLPPKDEKGNILPKDKDGKFYKIVKKIDPLTKKEEEEKEIHTSGERVFVTISIMLGAIKELSAEIKKLKKEIKNIKSTKK